MDYSEELKKKLLRADVIAYATNCASVRTDHLLLAMIVSDDSESKLFEKLLKAGGIEKLALKDKIDQGLRDHQGDAFAPHKNLPYSPQTTLLLQRAQTRASILEDEVVSSTHTFFGMLSDGKDLARQYIECLLPKGTLYNFIEKVTQTYAENRSKITA